jgi:hypothetical protein
MVYVDTHMLPLHPMGVKKPIINRPVGEEIAHTCILIWFLTTG